MQTLRDLLSKLGGLIAAFLSGFSLGALRQKNAQLKKENKGNEIANKIHNKIDVDERYRDRIRRMFRS